MVYMEYTPVEQKQHKKHENDTLETILNLLMPRRLIFFKMAANQLYIIYFHKSGFEWIV